ncbi:hypothetical protein PISMIDRAFT_16719 [Pisolithus microcarpus 441]|uniref:Uncharacterized protein n=1 Tax=Pisolithus microcarpus 441 TaxID=765257 RepID=A0A0C9YMK7_9AGAM|nr:hypothetical protein PISMIDRAFT_16719 [Pisolithus microcarpus 441]
MAWQQHLASAGSEEEHHRIHAARLLGERITSLPPLAEHAFPPDCRSSAPPSVRRAEARWGLATRAREDRDPNEYVGRHKCARVQQLIWTNQNEVDSRLQTGVDETATHSDESGLDIRYPIDPTEGNGSAGECHDDPEPFFPSPPSPSHSPPPDETNVPPPPSPNETGALLPTLPPNHVGMAPPEITYQ